MAKNFNHQQRKTMRTTNTSGRRLSLRRLMWNVVAACAVSLAVYESGGPEMGLVALTVLTAGTALTLLLPGWSGGSQVLLIGVQTEVWVEDIAEALTPANDFWQHSLDDSRYVNNRVVHLPQAGSDPNVEINRSVFPATVTQRTDTTVDYEIDEFSTDPIMVSYSEELEASYDMRASVLRSHLNTLKTKVADRLAWLWSCSVAGSILRTSGAARPAYKAGQTGQRKALSYEDFVKVMTRLDAMDVPSEGRVALIDSALMADLFKIEQFIDASKFGQGVLPKGAIGMVLGMAIYTRSRVQSYNNAAVPAKLPFGAANTADSNVAALFWHPNFVRRAVGNGENGGIVVSINEQRAEYNGATLISALVRAGGRIARGDEKGVVALVEEHA